MTQIKVSKELFNQFGGKTRINKAFQKRLQKVTDEQLMWKLKAFKYESHSNHTKSFDINYNTILTELENRRKAKLNLIKKIEEVL